MKKILFAISAVILLASCDASMDNISAPAQSTDGDALVSGITFTQYSDDTYTTEQEDGNYIAFTTNPSRVVTIYQISDDGEQNILSYGVAAGTFKLAPKRGGDSNQTLYVSSMNYDATTVTGSLTINVNVPSELDAEIVLIASDSYGSKIWKWDTETYGGGAWGNAGYAACSAADGDPIAAGKWWGCYPDDLVDQLDHAVGGVAYGDEDVNAYMVMDEEGKVKVYDANDNLIRSGSYSITGYDGTVNTPDVGGNYDAFSYGKLVTSENAIMFPYQINAGGVFVTEYEIVDLTSTTLKLVYAPSGTGSWSECTWWAFTSSSDAEACLADYSTKTWTWDTDCYGGGWGNCGYAAQYDDDTDPIASGMWWACAPEDLSGQLQHTVSGETTGEEDPDAYMTFNLDTNKVTSYTADGTVIRTASFEITDWTDGSKHLADAGNNYANYAKGYLVTGESGGILWPFMINAGGVIVTQYEIVELNANHLHLTYAPEGQGQWAEGTWWAFTAKE